MYEAASMGTIPPQVGNVFMWADRAMEGAEVAVVLMALDEAVRVLEEAGDRTIVICCSTGTPSDPLVAASTLGRDLLA